MNDTEDIYEYVVNTYDNVNALRDLNGYHVYDIIESIYSNLLDQICYFGYAVESCNTNVYQNDLISNLDLYFAEERDEAIFDFYMGLVTLTFLNYYNQKQGVIR